MIAARRACLLIFVATTGLDWPLWPLNARLADALFVLAAATIFAGQKRWSLPRATTLDLAVVVYLLGSVPAVLVSPDPAVGSVELVRQVYLAAVYAVIVLAVRQGLTVTVASGLALSGALLAALGLTAFLVYTISGAGSARLTPVMTLPYIGETVRLQPLTASPAMLACALAVAVPFAVLHPAITAIRIRAAGAALLVVATLLTFSHSAAGVAVSLLIAGWEWIRSQPLLRTAAVAVTVLIVVALNFAAAVSIRSIGTSSFRDDTVFQYGVDQHRARIAGVDVEYQTISYLRIKQVALEAFTSRPLTGVGLGRFHDVTETAYQQGRLTAPYRAIDPHSTFLGRVAEAGLIGGLTLIALWIAIGVAVVRLLAAPHHRWIAVAAAAGIAGTLVNSLNADVMNFRYLWVAIGLVRGLGKSRQG